MVLQVIYELTQGERQLIDDLSLVKKVLVHQTPPQLPYNRPTSADTS